MKGSGPELTLTNFIFSLQTGSRLPEDLESNPSIQFHYLTELPRVPEKLPRILYYLYAPVKAVVLAFQLFVVAMFQVAAPEVYVVQVRRSGWSIA